MNNRTFTQDLLGVQNDLLRFAYKLTSNREEANDLLQETSLKALDNEEKYTPDTNFKGWIYTIMRNIFINNYRKVVRDQTFVDTTDNLYHLNTPHDIFSSKTSFVKICFRFLQKNWRRSNSVGVRERISPLFLTVRFLKSIVRFPQTYSVFSSLPLHLFNTACIFSITILM